MKGYIAFVSKIIGLLQRLIGRRRRPLRLGRSRLGEKWAIGLLLCLVCGACSTHRRTTEVQIKREETKAAHERLVFDSIRVRDTLLVRTERDTVHVERHVHYERSPHRQNRRVGAYFQDGCARYGARSSRSRPSAFCGLLCATQ